MTVKHIVDEWFSDYKKPSMFIFTSSCSGKCCTELGAPPDVCHNYGWAQEPSYQIADDDICKRYLSNKITNAIVFGGLEPLEQIQELLDFVKVLRDKYCCADDIVIYTGYYPHEISRELTALSELSNIIIKFGRYIPDRPSQYDEVLGVELSSDNQYATKIRGAW